MENASKALIIAGSVLLSILLISIGIIIVNSSSGITDEASSASQAMSVSMFNSRFTQYCGNSLSASKVKSFVSTVIAHNSTCKTDDKKIILNLKKNETAGSNYISINNGTSGHQSTSAELSFILNKISNSYKYDIYVTAGCGSPDSPGGYTLDGYVKCMTIKPLIASGSSL